MSEVSQPLALDRRAAPRPADPAPARRRSRLFSAGVLLLALPLWYLAGPFVTLWRVNRAVAAGDLATLQTLIDWPSLRQGMKSDVEEGLLGFSAEHPDPAAPLPAFGAGFVAELAGVTIDRSITPQGLVAAARSLDGPAPAWPHIVSIGFAAPVRFDLRLRVPCQDADELPLRVRLAFRHGHWEVVRVWVPQDLVDRATPPG